MSKHTPEPWILVQSKSGRAPWWTVRASDSKNRVIASARGDTGGVFAMTNCQFSPQTLEANATRIVACVNALAGIDDPAAFVARLAALEEAVKVLAAAARSTWNFIPQPRKDTINANPIARAALDAARSRI